MAQDGNRDGSGVLEIRSVREVEVAKRRRMETMNLREAQETALKAFSEFVANKRLEWEVAGHSKRDWDNLLWEFVGKAVLELR